MTAFEPSPQVKTSFFAESPFGRVLLLTATAAFCPTATMGGKRVTTALGPAAAPAVPPRPAITMAERTSDKQSASLAILLPRWTMEVRAAVPLSGRSVEADANASAGSGRTW